MQSTPKNLLPVLVGLLMVFCVGAGFAAEPTPPRPTLTQPRTGNTNKFGSGTLTNRSDGSSSRTQPFGSGTLQTDKPGRKSR